MRLDHLSLLVALQRSALLIISMPYVTLIFGEYSTGDTPVPISNTEVKPCSADGTARETWWESRTLPDFYSSPSAIAGGLFL